MGPRSFRLVPLRLLLAGLLMLTGFGALCASATAQDDADPEATPVATEAPAGSLATPEANAGDDTADDAAVAALPDTGTGSGNGSTAIVVTAAALLAAMLGLAAIGARRLIGRHGA